MSLFKDYFLGSLLYQRIHSGEIRGGWAVVELLNHVSKEKDKMMEKMTKNCHVHQISVSQCSVSGGGRIRWVALRGVTISKSKTDPN